MNIFIRHIKLNLWSQSHDLFWSQQARVPVRAIPDEVSFGVYGGKKLTRDLSQFLNFDPYKKFSRWKENEASKT